VTRRALMAEIERSLEGISIGSYIFQSQVAADFGLYPTDMLALHLLNRGDGLTAGQLAEKLRLTSGATTTLVDRLLRGNLVTRHADPRDRRKVIVKVTGAAKSPLKQRYVAIDSRIQELLRARSVDELGVIARFLGELSGWKDGDGAA
jgi:DNA-binding MarR family transcriptional regulator